MARRGFYVDFKVPELEQELAKIGAYDTKTAARVEEAISTSTKNVAVGAKRRVAVRTGKLKKSIRASFNQKTMTGIVAAKAPYAHLIEFGAKPRTVKPNKQKALAIDEFGLRRYAKEARIPARVERPYLRPAFEEEKPNLIKNVKDAVNP